MLGTAEEVEEVSRAPLVVGLGPLGPYPRMASDVQVWGCGLPQCTHVHVRARPAVPHAHDESHAEIYHCAEEASHLSVTILP